jgi:hypothetical protein
MFENVLFLTLQSLQDAVFRPKSEKLKTKNFEKSYKKHKKLNAYTYVSLPRAFFI